MSKHHKHVEDGVRPTLLEIGQRFADGTYPHDVEPSIEVLLDYVAMFYNAMERTAITLEALLSLIDDWRAADSSQEQNALMVRIAGIAHEIRISQRRDAR